MSPADLRDRWLAIPLYARIAGGVVAGIGLGLVLGDAAAWLGVPARIVMRLLTALAPPLVLFAILRALLRASIPRGAAARLAWLLASNTVVAITIGLVVANLIRPGDGAKLFVAAAGADPAGAARLVDLFPKSLLGPLADQGSVLQVALIGLALGVALRPARERPIRTLADFTDIGFDALIRVLLWIIELLPLAVMCMAAKIVGTGGLARLADLGPFVVAVLLALGAQVVFYLLRVRLGSWVSPLALVRGTRDALVTAFSTASTSATMPVTYGNLTRRVGVRESSANLAALVGTNFNNDGTALYEAVAALFVAQALGLDLSLGQQVVVMLAAITASVGAAVPEAGLVSMTLVFGAVGLPTEAIGSLLVVDWLLDRCRTATNVLGDISVAALLDGRARAPEQPG